jgi:apolipoprotein N-acyltransferase
VAAQGYVGMTPYARWGNALALSLAGLFIGYALVMRYRRRH